MSLNLDDNKRPYFKQLNLDETFDEIQNYVNNLEGEVGFTTAEIIIPTSGVTSMGTTFVQILPAPGVNSYYEGELIFEVDPDPGFATVETDCSLWITYGPFNISSAPNIITSINRSLNRISTNFLSGTNKRTLVVPLQNLNATFDGLEQKSLGVNLHNAAVTMKILTPDYAAATWEEGVGGTIRVIVKYRVRTFGV